MARGLLRVSAAGARNPGEPLAGVGVGLRAGWRENPQVLRSSREKPGGCRPSTASFGLGAT